MNDTTPTRRRINVAVSPDVLSALDLIIEREGVTLTEAVRRLIGYGDFVYRAVKEDGGRILLDRADGVRREITLL